MMKRTLLLFTLILLSIGFAQEEVEVVVPVDEAAPEALVKIGDIAPSWALMYAPAKFEFLKNWTIEPGQRLRRLKTQPDRHVVIMS